MYTYALKYTKLDKNLVQNQLFHKVDTKADFLILAKRIYSDLTSNFDNCAETIMAHFAGETCLYCDPEFIQSFKYNVKSEVEVEFNYNVCYLFQKNCFKYTEARILIAGLKNLVLMLDQLYQINDLI